MHFNNIILLDLVHGKKDVLYFYPNVEMYFNRYVYQEDIENIIKERFLMEEHKQICRYQLDQKYF